MPSKPLTLAIADENIRKALAAADEAKRTLAAAREAVRVAKEAKAKLVKEQRDEVIRLRGLQAARAGLADVDEETWQRALLLATRAIRPPDPEAEAEMEAILREHRTLVVVDDEGQPLQRTAEEGEDG